MFRDSRLIVAGGLNAVERPAVLHSARHEFSQNWPYFMGYEYTPPQTEIRAACHYAGANRIAAIVR